MKIAHLISTFLPSRGGAETCVHNLASEQTKKGHITKVIAPLKGNLFNLNYEVLPLKQKTVFFSMLPIFNKFYFIEQLRDYQKRYKFDIWQITIGYPFGVAAIDFLKKNNIPSILRCSGEDIQIEPKIRYGARLHRWPDYLIRNNYPRFDGFISVGESITEDYLKIGVKKDKIYYIPNGVDRAFFDLKIDKDDSVKKYLGIDICKKLIITVGRNHPKKGFNYIPEIIKSLSKKRDDFMWLLIGKGSAEIMKTAQKNRLGRFLMTKENIAADNISAEELKIPNRELIKIYKSADIFVMPTLIEGCSTVITEAMASGLPVVSTDAIGVKDMIEDKETGLLSKKGDPEDISRNIDYVLNEKDLYKKIKDNALAKTRNLDWSSITDRYIDAYEDVIRKSKN